MCTSTGTALHLINIPKSSPVHGLHHYPIWISLPTALEMAANTQTVFIDEEKRNVSTTSFEKDHGTGTALETIDKAAERAYGIVPHHSHCHKI